jgi:hypothetical protein
MFKLNRQINLNSFTFLTLYLIIYTNKTNQAYFRLSYLFSLSMFILILCALIFLLLQIFYQMLAYFKSWAL